ncbi:MAG: response regulator transcription factor [Verrucomicrobia bacterium]|nr:response regulator transcription factor [Verrucomicrobiota bacterium]
MIEKLLIVDDHPAVCQWLRLVLRPLVRSFCESSDGAEAVQTYAEQQPDWVVMDIDMKPMDGLTATRLIKRQFPEARIVLMTGHEDPIFRLAAIEVGAAHFLFKEDLWQVRKILAGGSAN